MGKSLHHRLAYLYIGRVEVIIFMKSMVLLVQYGIIFL